jgi:hypothetical protein
VAIFFRKNSQVLAAGPIKDHNGDLVTTAAVSAIIVERNGNAIPEIANPISMSHEGGGTYSVTLPPIDLPQGLSVDIEVVAEYAGTTATSREVLFLNDRKFNQ